MIFDALVVSALVIIAIEAFAVIYLHLKGSDRHH